MGWKDNLAPFVAKIPTIEGPDGHVSFKRKIMWTSIVLFTYFFLSNVILFGLAAQGPGGDPFGQFRSILAGTQGSILQLGIGPIVTGSIIIQLVVGAGMVEFDQSDPRDQMLYQGIQKLLVIVMVVVTAIPIVMSGGYLPASSAVAEMLGLTLLGVKGLMLLQVIFGGLLILYLDEIVSKWGIGSGVGLFILAGISQSIWGGIFTQILPGWYTIITGQLQSPILSGAGMQSLLFGAGQLVPIFTTVLIFAVVVYAESTQIEIPLSHAQHKAGRARYPVKLIYASVLPLILVRALQANIQMIGQFANSAMGMPSWLGVYADGQPVGGFFYYLSPIRGPRDWMWWIGGTSGEPWEIFLRLFVDALFMVGGGAIFAIFWIRTTEMGPKDTAEKITKSGMQIPGFRRNKSVLTRVLSRYIPQVTIIGGALIGFLALLANMLGTIGGVTGTGLLLTVSITFKLYQQLAEEQMMEMHPMVRQMFQ